MPPAAHNRLHGEGIRELENSASHVVVPYLQKTPMNE
jgi:hypothetical protein